MDHLLEMIQYPIISDYDFENIEITEKWAIQTKNYDSYSWVNRQTKDLLKIYYQKGEASIPIDLFNTNRLVQFYRQQIGEKRGGIIQVDYDVIQEFLMATVLYKTPSKKSNILTTDYFVNVTFPFQDFSIVITISCKGDQNSNKREEEIYSELCKNQGKDNLELIKQNWSYDPYDLSLKSDFMFNYSEKEGFDTRFEQHPLSRLRKFYQHLKQNILFSHKLQEYPIYHAQLEKSY